MELTVYVDILFITNFAFDAILLWITGFLLKVPCHRLRLLFSAFLGGVYGVLFFLFPTSFFFSLWGKLIAGMVLICLYIMPKSLATCIRTILLFFAVIFMYSGAVLGLLALGKDRVNPISAGHLLYMPLPFWGLLSVSVFVLFLLYIFTSWQKERAKLIATTLPLFITYNKMTLQLTALYDTGNHLTYQGKGVVLLPLTAIKKFCPGKNTWREIIEATKALPLPCESIGGAATVYIFPPDTIEIKEGSVRKTIGPLYIGFSKENKLFCEIWNAILPSNYKGVEVN